MDYDHSNGGFNELVEQIAPEWRKLTPKQRAEIIMREFRKLKDPSPGLVKQYRLWLHDNAEIALETQAVRESFDENFKDLFAK